MLHARNQCVRPFGTYHIKCLFFMTLLFVGCQTEPRDFTLSFTIESINTYKISMTINPDKSYHIQQQNMFLDAYAGKEQINTSQGTLTDEAYTELKELITASRLFKMKDSYGFDKKSDDSDALSEIIYQIGYTENRKTKNITMRHGAKDNYPQPFLQMIRLLTSLCNNG